MKTTINRSKRVLRENLTPLRGKILRELKKDTAINNVRTIDSRIFCTQYEDGREVKIIDSPDYLFKIGWDEEKVISLGLY